MRILRNAILPFVIPIGLWAQAPSTANAGDQASSKESATPEDLVKSRAVVYKPIINRDPFAVPTELEGPLKGELVEDMAVKGVIRMGGKPLAVISDSRGSIRWLPIGYKFKDGEIAAIDDKSVTFHQWDVNSTVRNAFKTVVKTFKREEGKR